MRGISECEGKVSCTPPRLQFWLYIGRIDCEIKRIIIRDFGLRPITVQIIFNGCAINAGVERHHIPNLQRIPVGSDQANICSWALMR